MIRRCCVLSRSCCPGREEPRRAPNPCARAQKVKKQAYGLRFILEAPELEISPEERVKIPVGVEGADDYTCAPGGITAHRALHA